MNETFLLNYLAMNTLSTEYDKNAKIEEINEITDNLIERIVELNVDLPLETLKERIGTKIAITRYKKEASLSEIQNAFNNRMKAYLEKIENLKI